MIYLSIIIPAYNCQDTIIALLKSIANSSQVDFKEIEVIVVDDRSKDNTVKIVKDFYIKGKKKGSFGNVKIITLKKNQGPAYARNVGVKYASGQVVLFLDSDVKVYEKTINEIIRSFKDDLDLHALTGVWDKKQKTKKFFPKFKALRDWSYWINERDPRNYYYLFSTRIAAINKDLFLRLGGFDESYRSALVEDIELTYRIAKRYAVVFNPKVIVQHEFEDFYPIARKYFWRSFYWSRIYRERKKFDPVATTSKEAITTISAGGFVGFALLWIGVEGIKMIGGIKDIWGADLGQLGLWLFAFLMLFFVVHLFGVRKFIWFCVKEEGVLFAIKAFFTGVVLYLIILAGAGVSFISR